MRRYFRWEARQGLECLRRDLQCGVKSAPHIDNTAAASGVVQQTWHKRLRQRSSARGAISHTPQLRDQQMPHEHRAHVFEGVRQFDRAPCDQPTAVEHLRLIRRDRLDGNRPSNWVQASESE